MLSRETFKPGPIEEVKEIFSIKVPLEPVGLAFLIASTNAATFSARFFSVKEAFPTRACMIPAFSA